MTKELANAKKRNVDRGYWAQVAALPVRSGAAGAEVLLISSRETRRWIIPKGWPIKGLNDRQAAAREAEEEAGIVGKVRKHPIGAYTYQKQLNDHAFPCRVMVYRVDVSAQLETWREKDQRVCRWMPMHEAADLVSEPGLASMIRRLERSDETDESDTADGSLLPR